MSQILLNQAGTGHANMRVFLTYTVGNGYITISALDGSRSDAYPTGNYDTDLYLSIEGSSTTYDIGSNYLQWPAHPTYKNWANFGGRTHYTSATSVVVTLTFKSGTANIKNSLFTTTISIPQAPPPDPTPPPAPQYANITTFDWFKEASPTGLSRLYFNWGADADCDALQYSLDGGGWAGADVGNHWNGQHYLGGFAPGTQHSLRIRVKRSSSQQWTESSVTPKYATTYQIAQVTAVPTGNINMDNTCSVSYTNPSGAVMQISVTKPQVQYIAGLRSCSGSGYTFTFTQAEKNLFYARIPTANTDLLQFELVTYDGLGNSWINRTDKTFEVFNDDPTITAVYADQNATVSGITGSNQTMIAGLSDALVTASPTTLKGAYVTKVEFDGVADTSNPYTRLYTDVTAASVVVKVTDSRGQTATTTKTFTYVPYVPATLLSTFYRTAQSNNEIALQYSGTFFNDDIGETANAITMRYRVKPELEDWGTWVELTPTVDGNAFDNGEVALVIDEYFNHKKQYLFEIEVTDALNTITNSVIVKAGRPVLNITESVQVLQGRLHVQRLLTKNEVDFLFDFVYDVVTRSWLLYVYNINQLFEPQYAFQADVNTRSITTVLNKEGFPLLKYIINESADEAVDYTDLDVVAPYNNYGMIDTGVSQLTNQLEKRVRELQFTTYHTGTDKLEFFVTAYVDSRNVSSPDDTLIDWISDPDDPNYGQLFVIEDEVANVYGETNLEAWMIDYSMFPKIGLVNSHLALHGKGQYLRSVIVNRDTIAHEISGLNWVYRIMNAR